MYRPDFLLLFYIEPHALSERKLRPEIDRVGGATHICLACVGAGLATAANGDRKAPLVSPLYADLTNLPPLLIQVGESEVLLDDSKRLAERAKRYGVDVNLEIWPEMIHVWQLFAAVLPEAQQGIGHLGAFIRKHLT